MKPFIIVCLGDSITCEWDEPKYPTFWQELLEKQYGQGKVKVISAGVNGETAQDGYYRLPTDVIPHHPDLVTVMFGHNDVYWRVAPDMYNTYLRKIHNSLDHAGVPHIWLLSPNRVDDPTIATQYLRYLKAAQVAAREKDIPYIDLWPIFSDTDMSKIFTKTIDFSHPPAHDYVHPNSFGHRLIARHLMQYYVKTFPTKGN